MVSNCYFLQNHLGFRESPREVVNSTPNSALITCQVEELLETSALRWTLQILFFIYFFNFKGLTLPKQINDKLTVTENRLDELKIRRAISHSSNLMRERERESYTKMVLQVICLP